MPLAGAIDPIFSGSIAPASTARSAEGISHDRKMILPSVLSHGASFSSRPDNDRADWKTKRDERFDACVTRLGLGVGIEI